MGVQVWLAPGIGRENWMKHGIRTFALLVVAALFLALAGCGQNSNCSGITFGNGSGGSATGGVNNSGGSVCGPGSNNNGGGAGVAILYYLGIGPVVDAATVTSTTFANIVGYTPAAFPSGTGFGENFWIVNKKFLYVPITTAGTPGTGGISAYAITRSNGALTAMTQSPFLTATPHTDIVVGDPAGKFLFAADTADGEIAVFQIDPNTGALTAVAGSPFPAGGGAPNHMVVDGTGTYLYYASGGQTYALSINQTSGALTPLFLSPFNVPMAQLAADPTGHFLFGVTAAPVGTDDNVYVIPIGQGTGNLGNAVSFPTTSTPDNLALDPSGKFLFTFALDLTGHALPIEGFTFDATTGNLTTMSGSPFSSLPGAAAGQFDQGGSILIGATASSFIVYNVSTTTGTPTSTIPALGAAHDERFTVTD